MTARKPFISAMLAFVMLVMIGVPRANAEDVLRLKDGRVLHGEVIREVDGYISFRYKLAGIEQEQWFKADEYESLERDAGAQSDVGANAKKELVQKKNYDPNVPRIAVITLGEGGSRDMVGIYMTAKALQDAIPMLEKDGVTDVVFHINSGGGLLLEIQRLSDVINDEYKPRFRCVAWIESAISAAAMTAHCLEEIYFKPEGNYGACTGWSGALVAVKGRQLEEVLYMMEKISAKGNHAPEIMRSMQILEPLSCTINERTGEVRWYQNTEGEIVVNDGAHILTFDAPLAEKTKFSRGTAENLDELALAMGYQEVVWVGEDRPGLLWPISTAEDHQMQFRAKTAEDERRTREYFTTYQSAVAIAQGTQEREDRAKFVNKARQALTSIDRMIKNNPNFALLVMGMLPEQYDEWYDEQQQLLRDLMK